MSREGLPLARFKVLDLSRVRAGPACVRQLADWGADCIKIEMPGDKGDGFSDGRDKGDFQNLHRNKRSMKLDLKSPEGKKIFMALAKDADVIVENYRPDVKHRLGIDYEAVSAINPRIVYASISGFGQDGPYANRPGVDQIAQGMSGLMSVTGEPGKGPMRAGAAVGDMSAGLFATIGILTALLEREASGKGQWIHTSLLEALITVMDFQSAAWIYDGYVPGQAGNNHPKSMPTGAYQTIDGYVNIGAGGDAGWKRVCEAIGATHLMKKPEYADADLRVKNREMLNADYDEVFRTKTTAQWVEIINKAGIPCGPIYKVDQTFADPQVQHLGIITPMVHPEKGERAIVGQPIHMSRTQWRMRNITPDAGEHTDEILRDLGYDQTAIDKLHAEGTV